MGLAVDNIVQRQQQHLAQFAFEALFLQDLGWAAVPATEGSLAEGMVLARWETAAVVLMADWPIAPLSRMALQHRLNQATAALADPLVILLADGGDAPEAQSVRSLWCWRSQPSPEAPWRFRALVRGNGDRDWAMRLQRLQAGAAEPGISLGQALNAHEMPTNADRLKGFRQGFWRSWQSLSPALAALSLAADRQHYGLVIVLRLIAIVALQQRGYLGGDEWYLHNQFGQSQQRGSDSFFTDVLQPLCQQGFVLPPEECPPSLRDRLGALPFVPTGPFTPIVFDHAWGQRPLPDAVFEPALEWLGDLLMTPNCDLADLLPEVLEAVVNDRGGADLVTPEPMLAALGDRTLNAIVLDWATDLTGQRYATLESLLMAISAPQAAELLTQLGTITLLDPACGSGRYLLWSLHQLLYLGQNLAAIVVHHPGLPLPPWLRSYRDGASPWSLGLYRQWASHSLYGVDRWPPALALARLQLFLAGVKHTQTAAELASLPDLTLTLLQGDALMGLVTVDDERFDQITLKGRRSRSHPWDAPPLPEPEPTPLQGNLLQPLMANTYQAILAERQVHLEHYRSQTELLGESGSVPAYAQADFLRERLEDINQTTQAKLTHLLWSEASQQLSIRIQRITGEGRRQSRPLTLADVEAMDPFHWGFYLHGLLRDRGGFDLILSHLPAGVVQPTEAGFLEAYADLFQAKGVAPSTFLNNHKQVLTIDPDLTQAWANYRGQFALPSQYFRRSGHYPYSGQPAPGQTQVRLYWSRLFLERSLQLLRPGGRCAVMMDPFWAMGNSAPLRHWLEAETQLGSVVDISNHGGLWPELSPRTAVSLLWLKKQGPTQGSPYSAYVRHPKAPAPVDLAKLLQRLIHLAE